MYMQLYSFIKFHARVLFCVIVIPQGEGEEVFLELFEDEYSNEKVHTVQYIIQCSHLYLLEQT